MIRKHQNLFIIMLIAILLRLPAFLYNYVNIDEIDYALAAKTILSGGVPYKDFLIYQPPVIYYIYALGFYLSGGINLWAVHLITVIFVALTVATLYSLTKRLTNSESGGLAAALAYAVYSTTFIPQDMLAANCEVLMVLPMTLSALFLFLGYNEKKLRNFFLSGIFVALSVLTKYQGGILLAAALIYINILEPVIAKKFSLKNAAMKTAVFLAGFVLPIALVIFYLYERSAIAESYEAFKYIVLYAKGPVQSDGLYIFLKFVARTFLFSLPTAPIWIGSLYVIQRVSKKNFRDTETNPFVSYMILWFVFAFAPILAGGRIYFHYYYIILPAAAALSGIWWSLKSGSIRPIFKYTMITWMVICATGWSSYAVHKAIKGPSKKETWVAAADYLKKIAKPGDTMFVWGLCYQLYFFSRIELATRFTAADYLTGRSPMTAGLEYDPSDPNPPSSLEKLINDFKDHYHEKVFFNTSDNIFSPAWKYFREDIEKKLPTYIVDTSPSNYRRYARYPIANYPYLENLLKANYEEINKIDGYVVYKLKF